MARQEFISIELSNHLLSINDFFVMALNVYQEIYNSFDYYFKRDGIRLGKIEKDEKIDGKAIIYFCAKKYQIELLINPTDRKNVFVKFSSCIEKDQWTEMGRIKFDHLGNIEIPGTRNLLINEELIQNAVLQFFLNCVLKKDLKK